jgi:hypothetical protein
MGDMLRASEAPRLAIQVHRHRRREPGGGGQEPGIVYTAQPDTREVDPRVPETRTSSPASPPTTTCACCRATASWRGARRSGSSRRADFRPTVSSGTTNGPGSTALLVR